MKKLKKLVQFIQNNKKFALLVLFFIAFYVVLFIFFQSNHISQAEIQKFVEPYGFWGLFVLLIAQITFSLTPLPDGARPMIAYALYGPIGVIVIGFGMYIAGLLHYFIGHKLGKHFIVKHFPQITHFLGILNNGNTILKLVYLRMFTVISFDVTSYLAGISNISLKTFTIAFVLWVIPNNFTLMLVSSGLFAKTVQERVIIWLLVIVSITLLAYLYKRSKIKIDNP